MNVYLGSTDFPPPVPLLVEPPSGSVLVLAPHPDDESIGCGGVLALHARRGDPVLIVTLTDGAAGDPDGLYDGRDYRELRENETRQALGCLALHDVEFLRLPDGRLAQAAELDRAIADVVRRVRPDIVYAPSPWETLADHWAAARALERVLQAGEGGPAWWAYEIWTPLVASHIVDIGSVWEQKRRAILCYQSQLRYVDYLERVEGLARYRTLHAPALARAEAFRLMKARP